MDEKENDEKYLGLTSAIFTCSSPAYIKSACGIITNRVKKLNYIESRTKVENLLEKSGEEFLVRSN